MVGGRWIVWLGSVTAIGLLAATGTQATGAVRRDAVPPTFAGLEAATTCIPGPVGGGERTGSYRLTWAAARDRVTRASRIVYDVYQATSPGDENYAQATYTTRGGALTFVTPPLPSTEAYYFVVRARDAAGNRDRNRRERRGVNLCY
jgi:hypothetical protein